jgi:hypothetical protein
MFSNDLLRQKETLEIDATIKKMMIATELPRPKSCPLPDAIASLYV